LLRFFFLLQPEGGVKAGNVFQGQVVPAPGGGSGVLGGNHHHHQGAHYGSWRDGIWDCCRHGFFHPHLWMGCCCRFCLLGQVAGRLPDLWTSLPGTVANRISPFRLFFAITVVAFMAQLLAGIIQLVIQIDDDDDDVIEYNKPAEATLRIPFVPAFLLFLCQLVHWLLGLFCFVAVILIRRHVRKVYKIPACHDVLEDVFCACCCQSCTICQLARHTADYNTVDAELCSETGLAPHHTMDAVAVAVLHV
jgi:Cys-rich protein (TIGR01571 family)